MIFAHISGVPVEETLPTLVSAGTVLLVTRTRLIERLRRRRELRK
jgi:hypothetical protein